MKIDRRQLLAGVAALALLPKTAEAWFPHGVSGAPPVPHGWNTLPFGCGGLITGMDIALDGTMVCRSDVGNAYVWSGTSAYSSLTNAAAKWNPLINYASFAANVTTNPQINRAEDIGAYELRVAPNNSQYLLMIGPDVAGAVPAKYWVYYSTDKGTNWTQSALSMKNADSNNHGPPVDCANASYKAAFDPANPQVAYVGMPNSSGNAAGVYTTFDRTAGTTWPTFNAATTDGSTAFSLPTLDPGVCGICFDSGMGTTTVGGQTVTKHIIIPIAGVGIYESTDGGVSWTEIAVSAFGGTNFYVYSAAFNVPVSGAGIYYCSLGGTTPGKKIYRYINGSGWTDITPTAGYGGTGVCLCIDPSTPGTLIVTGNGASGGYKSTNADTTHSWTGAGGHPIYLQAPSYDIPYLQYIGGSNNPVQGQSIQNTTMLIDGNGTCFFPGGQGIWFFGTSAIDPTPVIPTWPNSSSAGSMYPYSFGRGTEAVIAQDILCPPGCPEPILAAQDVGAPMRGTFTSYPKTNAIQYTHLSCSNLEYAASDPSFIVARTTVEGGNTVKWYPSTQYDFTCWSSNYGADGTWNIINQGTDYLETLALNGTSDGTTYSFGGFTCGTLTVNLITGSGRMMPGQDVYDSTGKTYYGFILPYGSNSTSGTGSTGTYVYQISGGGTVIPAGSPNLTTTFDIDGGQVVAVDADHWVAVPAGINQHLYPVPLYTSNATSTCDWNFTDLPSAQWIDHTWSSGPTNKPFAVGYGSDLGTVWAALYSSASTGSFTIYKSTNSGATFGSALATITGVGTNGLGSFILSVPGYPGELWLSAQFSGSGSAVWHSPDAGVTWTKFSTPSSWPYAIALALGINSGGYPYLYLISSDTSGLTYRIYQGTWNGTTLSWSLYGPNGNFVTDGPKSVQYQVPRYIRGDWNVTGRIYIGTRGSGFAFYNP